MSSPKFISAKRICNVCRLAGNYTSNREVAEHLRAALIKAIAIGNPRSEEAESEHSRTDRRRVANGYTTD